MSIKSSKKLSQKIINQLIPELKESAFYIQDFQPVLYKTVERLGSRKIEQIICYGLGSFHNGIEIASRYQLALLLIIYDELIKLDAPLSNVIEIFDPSFEPADLNALRTFSHVKFHLIEKNEHCARKMDKNRHNSTFIYMPHLDKHFYNNLLGANWYAESIDRLVILGNSFQAMIDYETTSACKTKLYYINLLVTNFGLDNNTSNKRQRPKCGTIKPAGIEKPKALVELVIESKDADYWEIFNNLAFHFINDSWIKDNKDKIEQYRLIGWHKIVQNSSDSECQDDQTFDHK